MPHMLAPTPRRVTLPFAITLPGLAMMGLAMMGLVLLACRGETPPGADHCSGVPAALAVLRPPTVDLDSAEVSPANLLAWVERLTAPELRGRHATSDEARVAAAMIARHMSSLGLEAPFPHEGYCQGFPLQDEISYNVVGHLPAKNSRQAILLGAHYDGQGMHPAGLVYPSADDNASGVAALLEVARLAAREPWPFDLIFAALNAEEIGQVGSLAWVAEPTVSLSRLRFMMNFDMVGRPWPGSPAEAIGFEAWDVQGLSDAAATSGIEIRRLTELFSDAELKSDSTVFRRHVPTVFLSTGLHEDYHQRTDTADRVNLDQLVRVVRLALAFLESSATESSATD